MTSDEDEIDDGYERLLAEIGRSEEEDQSVACHEAAHCLAWLLLNSDTSRKIARVTITPGDTYEGRVWGERQSNTFARDIDASDVRGVLEPLMPGAGEDRANIADVFSSVYHQCLEYVSGRIGEEMFSEGSTCSVKARLPALPTTIGRHASLLRCSANRRQAVESFIKHCEDAARDLLAPYWYVLIALSVVLKIKRELTGDEVVRVVADTVARFELAAEQARRRRWQERVDNADQFDMLTET
jgi:hypothetical protein